MDRKLPVTLISGFLGSGKTTLLNSVLKQNNGLKIAVIVNDMGEVNIDSDFIASQCVTATDTKIVEMHNGCICCTIREDLLLEIAKLAKSYQFDYLVIESTGISEPLPVAETFTFHFPDGERLDSLACLDNLVTVVDGANFLAQYKKADLLAPENLESDKTISDLLIEQVEFSNVLLISKKDLISDSELQELHAILSSLNSKAEIVSVLNGDVPLELIVGTGNYSLAESQKAPGWLSILRGERNSETESYGIDSIVWHSRTPLHPARFAKFLCEKWEYGQILRSKGFFWLASQLESIGLWNQAGGIMRYQYAGQWWAYTSKEDWPKNPEVLEWVMNKWDSKVGDCRQEIVFIGKDIQKEKLVSELNRCLLTDEELARGPQEWQFYDDQFPLWMETKAELPLLN